MKHVVVTGGAGFIGSHLVDAYLARGWRVSVIDDLSSGSRRNLNPRATLYVADLRDRTSADLITELHPDVVSHHAAQISVRESVSDPARDAELNVVSTVALLQKAVEAGVSRFTFASTGGAIYGEPEYAPQDEAHPTRPLSPYGCAKLSVEHYLEYFRVVHGLSTVALRYGNVYGPRQSGAGEAGVIAIFIERLLAGETPMINGDGQQTRDYVFIDDVVAANVAVIDRPEVTGVLNVGTGIETSVNDLLLLITEALDRPIEPEHAPAKAGEQRRSVLDSRRLRDEVNVARPVAIAEGVVKTVAWFQTRQG